MDENPPAPNGVEDFRSWLRNHPPMGFKLIPIYSKEGDFISWYWEDEGCYGEQIHHDGKHIGTIHRKLTDKSIIGVTINREAIDKITEAK
jgi:hypothetical protein